MLRPLSLLADGNLGEGLFYAAVTLVLLCLTVAIAIIIAISIWVARIHRRQHGVPMFGRALLGGLIGGILAGAFAAVATVPLGNLPGGWFWMCGFPLICCAAGTWLGASLATHATAKHRVLTGVLTLLLIGAVPASRLALYSHYRRPPIAEAIRRIEAGDETVLRHLTTYGTESPAIVTAMISSLDRFPTHARRDAILTLGEVGAHDKRTTEALQTLINKNDQEIRAEDAAAVIGALGYQGAEATPVLLEILHTHSSANCRISAAIVLARIQPRPPQLLPTMIDAAEDPDPQVRQQAFTVLENLQPPAEDIVPQLAEIYGRAQPSERQRIEQLILRLDPKLQLRLQP